MEYSEKELETMLNKHIGLKNEDNNIDKKIIIEDKLDDIIENDDIIIENDVDKIKENKLITIPTISLNQWIKKYIDLIPENIKIIKYNITGVDNNEFLLVKVPHPIDEELSPGIRKQELIMFRFANRIPVLDLDIVEMSIYTNWIKMIHKYKDGFIKCYAGKANYLVSSLSNNKLIPYHIIKIKEKNHLIFIENNYNIEEILNNKPDMEIIKTLYENITKDEDWQNMKTNNDIFNYFIDLQKNIRNNIHHIKLDNIMIGMVTGTCPQNNNFAAHVKYQIKNYGNK